MNKKRIQIDCCILDMDGTIHLGGHPIPGVKEAVARMREKGKRIIFLTNNSSVSRKDYLSKLSGLDMEPSLQEIYTSGNAAIDWIKKNGQYKKIYLFGTENLRREFLEEGIGLSDTAPDLAVVAFDTSLTYKKLQTLCDFIRDGVPFIATHPDDNCPTESGMKPDVGAFLSLIETSTGKRPFLICGKPYWPIAESALSAVGAEPGRTAMFGDRLSTDIKFGLANKLITVLVLTGETDMNMYEKSGIKADFVLPSLAEWDSVLE